MHIETRICDCCNQAYSSPHQSLEKSFNSFGEDICPNCYKLNPIFKKKVQKKREETNLKKYGVKTPAQNKDILNKIYETNMSRYGQKTTLLDKTTQDKIKNTLVKNYGVDNPRKSKEINEKIKQTNLQKYGFENPMQNEQVKKKAEETNLHKYGVKSTAQVKEIREKMMKSLSDNNNVPTSKPQKQLYEKIKVLYPEYKCELNYRVSKLSLDIALFLPDIKIDIEYDGIYWHQDKHKDFKRDCVVKKEGYKVIRIKSNNKLPTDKQIISAIDKLIKQDCSFVEIIV